MIVACEKCQTKFNVDEERIKDGGSKVRCSQCKHVFTIFKPEPEAALPSMEPAASPIPKSSVAGAASAIDEGQDDFLKDLGSGSSSGMGEDLSDMFGDDFGETEFGGDSPAPSSGGGGMDLDALDKALAGDDDLGLGEEPKSEPGGGDFDFKSLEEDLALDDDLDLPTPSVDAVQQTMDDFGLEEETSEDLDATIAAGFNEETPKTPDLFVPPALAKELMKKAEEEEHDQDETDDDEDEFDASIDDDIAAMAERLAEKPAKKRRALLWVLVIVLVLIAAGGGVYYFAPNLLSPLGLGPKPPVDVDPNGNKNISLSAEKHFFRQNNNVGQILVITGLATNQYAQPRRFLRLKGMLNDAKGAVLAERQVYCGNVLSEDELTVMKIEDIQKMLNVHAGQNGLNLDVGPGKSIKFMIVFDAIPNTLAEYTVEAAGSEPMKK